MKDLVAFYNDCLDEEANSEKVLYYYTMGEEKWKKTSIWPPKGQVFQKWYFSNNNNCYGIWVVDLFKPGSARPMYPPLSNI